MARATWIHGAGPLVGAVALAVGLAASGPTASPAAVQTGQEPAAAGAGPAASREKPALHVIPFPGTPDASATSEIIFQSLPRGDLRSLTVTGSHSGGHPGHLKQLPDSAGTAFTPTQPFDSGELVTVKAQLASRRDGALMGDPGADALSFWFRVQVVAPLVAAADPAARKTSGQTSAQRFHSAPGLHPPALSASADADTTSGDLLLTPGGGQQSGPMILNAQGKLVWFQPVFHQGTANLQVQRYRGHPVLTYWQGVVVWGKDVILNRSYRRVATVNGAEGYLADVHEFQITPRGTALIDALAPVEANLTSAGGPRHGGLLDCVIQELDIRTGQLLWEWHALGHVPPSASYAGKPHGSRPYDYCHLNSIQQLPGGDLLVSARNTWGVYKINRATGRVLWSLGGKHSSFRMRRGTRFAWQHDARLSGRTLSLFDDGASPQVEAQSSAKVLRIDPASMTVSLVRRYTHSPPLLSPLAGSTQILPNHNVFVGWGGEPDFSEYSPSGRQIFNGTFPVGVGSYRALRSPWSGHPATRPAIALSTASQGGLRVYASWNGDTQVASWRILGGSTAQDLGALGRWPKTGFESTMRLRAHPGYLKVQALDQGGRPLGSSVVRRSS